MKATIFGYRNLSKDGKRYYVSTINSSIFCDDKSQLTADRYFVNFSKEDNVFTDIKAGTRVKFVCEIDNIDNTNGRLKVSNISLK